MEYLIVIYEDEPQNTNIPEIKDMKLVNEDEMFIYLQNNKNKGKYTINKVECMLDYS